MGTVTSQDGTTISYDVTGAADAPALIVVDGATAYRAINEYDVELAELLSDRFRVYLYDRRGRGESTDTAPYAVEREIEDLAALIAEAGGSAVVLGFSSGSVLALEAATAGLPISRVVMFEPPFVVDDSRPPAPADYVARLETAVAEGRPGDAVEIFMTTAVLLPAEMVAGMRQAPFWAALEAVAPTISYDGRVLGDAFAGTPGPLPANRWAKLNIPTLVMYGNGTEPWLQASAKALGDVLPTATVKAVEGAQHSAPQAVIAAEVKGFVG